VGWASTTTLPLSCGDCPPPLPFLDLGAFNWVWFGLKTALIMFTFQWIRWSVPRLRMDQLMDLGWKVLVPLTLIYLFVVAAAMLVFQEVL
jgi:NADH-quinone oxidoreductase subunit H